MLNLRSRALRRVLAAQAAVTVAGAAAAGGLVDGHAAASAGIGGGVGLASGLAFAAMISLSRPAVTAGDALRVALRAEAVKVLVIVALLWLAFKLYAGLVPLALIGAFIASVMIFSLAAFAAGE
jgi:ATP synthase protein I